MKVIYVAGKYSGGCEYEVKKNIAKAEDAAVLIWQTKKAAAICPHLNTSHWGGLLTHQEFIDGDVAILSRCDAVYFLPKWQESKGASLEHDYAIASNKRIFYRMSDLLVWLDGGTL